MLVEDYYKIINEVVEIDSEVSSIADSRRLLVEINDKVFRDAKGREITPAAVVYTIESLDILGYLLLGSVGVGTGGDPRELGALEIRHSGASPSLQADETLYKALAG